MEYFNTLAFESGILLMFLSFFTIIVYYGICLIWKIPIVKYAVFSDPWFSIDKYKVNDTDFVLGWLPFGSYIKPYGMGITQDSDDVLEQKFIPMPIFEQSKLLQFSFKSTPVLVWLVIFIGLVFISGQSSESIFYSFLEYIKAVAVALFETDSSHESLIDLTNELIQKTSSLSIVVLLFTVFSLVSQFITLLNSFFSIKEDKSKSLIVKIIGYGATLFGAWMILWKIPVLIFSFFSVGEIVVSMYSYLLGSFISGSILFYLSLMLGKMRQRK